MTLGDELRAVLNQEANAQITQGPDMDRLITGGRVRRRRRNRTRAGSTALAVMLIGGGAYAVTQQPSSPGSSGIANQASPRSEPSGSAAAPALPGDPGPEELEPGTYRVLVGPDATGAAIRADLTVAGPGWSAGDYPTVQDGGTVGGFGVYRPDQIAAGSGCSEDVASIDVGDSPNALAQRLAELPGSTVVQPVTPREVLGQYALHLRLRIPQTCPVSEYYRVATTPRGHRGITKPRPDKTYPSIVIDFWVIERAGVPVVVDSWHQAGASDKLVDRIAEARDSITFLPRP
jgi:hypothetical protein